HSPSFLHDALPIFSLATPIFMQGPGNDTPLALSACAPLGSPGDGFGANGHRHVTISPVRSKAGGGPGCPSGCEPRKSKRRPSAAPLSLLEVQEQPGDRLRVLEVAHQRAELRDRNCDQLDLLVRLLPRLAGLDALREEQVHPLATEARRRVERRQLAPLAAGLAGLLLE